MKKMTIKEVYTKVTYKTINEMNEVMEVTDIMDGKLNDKKAISFINEAGFTYFTGSIRTEVVDRKFQIPMNVIEELIDADINGRFFDTQEEYVKFELPKPVFVQTIFTPINTVKLSITDDESHMKILAISIPKSVHGYLFKEYEIL